jgi:hypothetical protein
VNRMIKDSIRRKIKRRSSIKNRIIRDIEFKMISIKFELLKGLMHIDFSYLINLT